MKITLPTMGNAGLTEKVHNHFGSARFFTIYDTETKTIECITNDNEHHAHGACQPLDMIAGLGVHAILTGGMGKRAVHILNEGGIKVFLLEGNTVEEAITKFEKNELRELTPDMACMGHSCH